MSDVCDYCGTNEWLEKRTTGSPHTHANCRALVVQQRDELRADRDSWKQLAETAAVSLGKSLAEVERLHAEAEWSRNKIETLSSDNESLRELLRDVRSLHGVAIHPESHIANDIKAALAGEGDTWWATVLATV